MQRKWIVSLLATLFLTVSAGADLWAQKWVMQSSQDKQVNIRLAGNATYEFIGSEFSFSNEVVKGAPYSANAVTLTTQVLGDGNRILRQTVSRIYRDSEGRTRREQRLPSIGAWVPEAADHEIITISDPAAGISYSLNPGSMEASKTSRPNWNYVIRTLGDAEDSEGAEHYTKLVVKSSTATAALSSKEHNIVVERLHEVNVAPFGAIERINIAPAVGETEPITESLGTRDFDGVTAEGTRSVVTIAAGSIGNELPIEIVTERWYSEELQTAVMRRHYDPRFGETLYRLESIELSEPDPELFKVPADYTITEGGNSFIHLKEKLHELRERQNH